LLTVASVTWRCVGSTDLPAGVPYSQSVPDTLVQERMSDASAKDVADALGCADVSVHVNAFADPRGYIRLELAVRPREGGVGVRGSVGS
jgi:hypothetical protein